MFFLIVFFDGEEAVLPNWSDSQWYHPSKIQDNTYGSRYMAKSLVPCSKNNYCDPYKNTKIQNIILMDMIGAKDIHLTLDAHSSPKLLNLAVNLDKKLNKKPLYKTSGMSAIDDDHILLQIRDLLSKYYRFSPFAKLA